jgi:hypothetical protein
MIISQIIGGLGNQMFQYAAGRALSLKNDTTLTLDISGFENYGLHQGFELQRVFTQTCEIASEADIRRVLGWQSPLIIRRIISQKLFTSFCNQRFIVEPHFQYWHEVSHVPIDCYLSGYWQSERYFFDVASQIRTDFTFKSPLEGLNVDLSEQIHRVNAVSLHVRRGDYANNPKTTATHGLCSIDYYLSAIRHVAERVKTPFFFIFSDDIHWVKNNLKINYPCQYVGHNYGAESYNDMRLMSLCKHHIIANSSFSWWGAWLNSSAEKIVVSPKRWFAIEKDTFDLIPQNWVKM